MIQSPAYAEEMPTAMTVDNDKLESVLRSFTDHKPRVRPVLRSPVCTITAEEYQTWLNENGALLEEPE